MREDRVITVHATVPGRILPGGGVTILALFSRLVCVAASPRCLAAFQRLAPGDAQVATFRCLIVKEPQPTSGRFPIQILQAASGNLLLLTGSRGIRVNAATLTQLGVDAPCSLDANLCIH
jgi:hypothetical protein